MLLTLLIISMPLAVSAFLVNSYFNADLSAYAPEGLSDLTSEYPLLWSDELDYWHEILTFVHYGFRGGYYTFEETPPKIAVSHFGTHGPAFPILYGIFGRIIGWEYYFGPFFNILFLTAAIVFYLVKVKPDLKQSLLLLATLAVFWPLWLFIPSTMQESLHHAGAVIISAMLSILIKRRHDSPAILKAAFLIALSILALVRPSWAFLFFPFFLIVSRSYTLKRFIFISSMSLGMVLLFFTVGIALSAPYPHNFVTGLGVAFRQSFIKGLDLLFTHVISNVKTLILPHDHFLVVLQRYLLVLLIFLNMRGLIAGMKQGLESADPLAHTFHAINLGIPLLFCLVFYDFYFFRDLRLLSAPLLLSLLLYIAEGRLKFTVVSLALLVMGFAAFAGLYKNLHKHHFTQDKNTLQAFEKEVVSHVTYAKNSNPWCNSFFAHISSYPLLKSLPPGIGINTTINWGINLPFKSRYVLLPADIDRFIKNNPDFSKKVRMDLLSSSAFGNLYVNRDTSCLSSSSLVDGQ